MDQNWKKVDLMPCDIEFLQDNEKVFTENTDISKAMIELIDRFKEAKKRNGSLSWEAIFYFLSCDTDMWDHLDDSFIEACGASFCVFHAPKEIHNDKITTMPFWFSAPELEVADFSAVTMAGVGGIFDVRATFETGCTHLKKVILPKLSVMSSGYSMFEYDYKKAVEIFMSKEACIMVRKQLDAYRKKYPLSSAGTVKKQKFIGI